LPSKWLEHWHSEPEERPDWLAECDAPTQQLLESNDLHERASAQTLWLILGHADRVEELFATMATIEETDKDAASDNESIDLLSWLPSERRLAEVKQRVQTLDGDSERIVELLTQATWIDDRELADWIFDLIETEPLGDEQLNASLADLSIRAQIGDSSMDLPAGLDENNYRYYDKSPYHIVESVYAPPIPGRIEACEWLREKFQSEASDRQRAIALIALAKLDHQAAANAAIGAIREANKDTEILEVALAIALFDAPKASADRAAELLDHSVSTVQLAAMQTLALPGSSLVLHENPNVPTIDNSAGVLPGFWLATQSLPVPALQSLSKHEDSDVQSQAKLLLLAAGEKIDVSALHKALEEQIPATSSLAIAAALAKANRTDESSLQHYQSTYESAADDSTCAELYKVLKVLKGEEVAKLRSRMRAEKGAALFNTGPNVIPPPAIRY
jgi:hypothetical protein